MQGVVSNISDAQVEVQVGMLRVRAEAEDLERPLVEETPAERAIQMAGQRVDEAIIKPSKTVEQPTPLYAASPGVELDLRGQRAEEALEALERYLDSATYAGLPFVRIIHGKGTGKLREAVRQALQGHPHVRSFEAGGENEGGDGVTVVKLSG